MKWVQAEFESHVFHYRMPGTAAISAVNPIIPSPLTVKMAMVAALLRGGRQLWAQTLADFLHALEVHIVPPQGALVYRSLMRYVRPPRNAGDQDTGTGSVYTISPHYREFALWAGPMTVYAGAADAADTDPPLPEIIRWALARVDYLGAKDSLVTCTGIEMASGPPPESIRIRPVNTGVTAPGGENGTAAGAEGDGETHPQGRHDIIVRLADVARPVSLETIIPGGRKLRDYTSVPYSMPGSITARSETRIYQRDAPRRGWTVLGP